MPPSSPALPLSRPLFALAEMIRAPAPSGRPGPVTPVDVGKALREEIDRLQKAVAASADGEAKARLAAQAAEAERRELEGRAEAKSRDRAFWETYAAEAEAALRTAERSLAKVQTTANAGSAATTGTASRQLAADSAEKVARSTRRRPVS